MNSLEEIDLAIQWGVNVPCAFALAAGCIFSSCLITNACWVGSSFHKDDGTVSELSERVKLIEDSDAYDLGVGFKEGGVLEKYYTRFIEKADNYKQPSELGKQEYADAAFES